MTTPVTYPAPKAPKTRLYTVTIRHLTSRSPERTVRVRAITEADALARGVAKAYGPRCSLQRDAGLSHGYYGQIVCSLSPAERRKRASGAVWAADAVTGRVRILVEEG